MIPTLSTDTATVDQTATTDSAPTTPPVDPSTQTDVAAMQNPDENTVIPSDIPTTTHPVTIGGVTINEPIMSDHVLASQGIIEVDNGDGTRSQYSIADAKARMTELESLKTKLGNLV